MKVMFDCLQLRFVAVQREQNIFCDLQNRIIVTVRHQMELEIGKALSCQRPQAMYDRGVGAAKAKQNRGSRLKGLIDFERRGRCDLPPVDHNKYSLENGRAQ